MRLLLAVVLFSHCLWLTTAQCPSPPEGKVTICHGTGSDSNPYVSITVDESSVYIPGVGEPAEHFKGHTIGAPHSPNGKYPDLLAGTGGLDCDCNSATPPATYARSAITSTGKLRVCSEGALMGGLVAICHATGKELPAYELLVVDDTSVFIPGVSEPVGEGFTGHIIGASHTPDGKPDYLPGHDGIDCDCNMIPAARRPPRPRSITGPGGAALCPGAEHIREGKVQICHGTGSDKNPYVLITVDEAAVYVPGVGEPVGDHFKGHTIGAPHGPNGKYPDLFPGMDGVDCDCKPTDSPPAVPIYARAAGVSDVASDSASAQEAVPAQGFRSGIAFGVGVGCAVGMLAAALVVYVRRGKGDVRKKDTTRKDEEFDGSLAGSMRTLNSSVSLNTSATLTQTVAKGRATRSASD